MFCRQLGMKKYAVWQDKLHVTSNSASTSLFNISLEFQGKKNRNENCWNVSRAHFAGYRKGSCE